MLSVAEIGKVEVRRIVTDAASPVALADTHTDWVSARRLTVQSANLLGDSNRAGAR